MKRVFLFFSMLSKKTNPGFITPEMVPRVRPANQIK
jgi:hypothetical protein